MIAVRWWPLLVCLLAGTALAQVPARADGGRLVGDGAQTTGAEAASVAPLQGDAREEDAATPVPRPPNPHFVPGRCESCHAPAPSGAQPGDITWAAGTADDTCSSCHATAPHEVGIHAHRRGDSVVDEPGVDRARVPEEFPLPGDMIGCLTCHDEPACTGRSQDADNPRFFRGGPYESMGGLCELCHAAADEVRFNPHLAMEEKRETTAICEFCHDLVEGEPDLDVLKIDRVAICYGCHKDTRHTGSAEHIEATIDPEMRTRAEAGGLPLTPDGEVFCGTCHDPHAPGSKPAAMERVKWAGKPLFDDPWLWSVLEPILQERADTLDTDPMGWTVEPDFMRKPLRGNALCGTCHTPEDTERRRRDKKR